MPLGYKYVERDADSQLNWAEIGKSMTDMLLETNRVREDKKAAYDQATREAINNLESAPQGEDQDANTFTNNFAHDMINQMRINDNLFKKGLLKERDYTLQRQNSIDGTKTLFEIQKLYQDKYKEKMDGIMSGKLQAMNIFNMKMVEGYGDFNNSKATIDASGRVGIGLMETKIIDGKSVKVLSKNIAPVNVIRGKILHDIETFDIDKATSDSVKNFGTRKDVLYEHATTSGAGSITEYMGPDFLATLTDPVDQKIVKDMNLAIDSQVNSFLANPYHISSILTQNTGKYNENSFTFDKDVAAKDKSKILVKINPTTQLTELDSSGPNYKAQEKEAFDWARTDMLRKMDQERSIKTTSQEQLQESAETKERAAAKYRPKPKGEETPKPTEVGEILALTTTNSDGSKEQVGVTQRIENLVFPEGKGIENVATSISYNAKNGTLELSGYQVSGKEEAGNTTPGEDGVVGKKGKSVVRKKNFVKNDLNNAPLLSTMILKVPNPERPGYNFSGIKEAKSYYKRQFEGQAGQRPIQFDANGNIIQ